MKESERKKRARIIATATAVAIFIFAVIACSKPEADVADNDDHEHRYIIAEIEAPTCTANGYEKGLCRCGGEIVTEKPMTCHKFGKYKYNNDGTCTKNGTETARCENCSETSTREKAETQTEHVFIEYKDNHDGTCTKNGTETARCENCDETSTRDKENGKVPHETEKHDGKAATCDADGWKAYETCKNCDYSTYEKLDASGHRYVGMICAVCTKEDEENKLKNQIIENDVVKGYTSSVSHEITEITVADGVKGIDDGAFMGYTKARRINLPATVERIGTGAFDGCKSISEIRLPTGILEIGDLIFNNCEQAIRIYYAGTAEQWESVVKGDLWNYGPTITVICEMSVSPSGLSSPRRFRYAPSERSGITAKII